MRKFLILAAFAGLVSIPPTGAEAQNRGVLGGAAAGGVAGAAVGGPIGAAVGAVGGAVVGNRVYRDNRRSKRRVYYRRYR